MNISAVVLVKNSALTLAKTLDSLVAFNDVVVYDNGSTDNSAEIARSYANVNLVQGEFRGFGWTKNEAASHARHDWVLIIDSDEVVDAGLLQALQTLRPDENTVYLLNFKAYYKETQVHHCGWNNQKIKRLYNRRRTSYNDRHVHENIHTDGMREALLPGNVEHYSYHSLSQFIHKADYYSTLFAQNNVGKRSSSPARAYFNGLYSFIRTYIIRQGFRDGYIGLVIAFSHMVTNFFKYMKLYELNREINNKKDRT